MVEDGRPSGQDRGDLGRGRRIEREGAEVLHHDQVGIVEGGGQLGRAGGRAAPMDSPPTGRSTGPSPATVTVVNPSSPSAHRHLAASMETPSEPPRRKERRAAVGMASP